MSDLRKKPEVDSAKAEAFAGRLLRALNDGCLCLMISIGHRVGLFDAMREFPPATSDEIARHAGLNERYVREWLGAMVTGRDRRGRSRIQPLFVSPGACGVSDARGRSG